MKDFIVERYVIYVQNIINSKNEIYIIEKYNLGSVLLKSKENDTEKIINISKIKEKQLYNILERLQSQISLKRIQYANKSLIKYFRGGLMPDILEYGDMEKIDPIHTDMYNLQIERYFYNPKGKLFEKLFNCKWEKIG